MQETAPILIAVGSLLVLGIATDYLGKHTFLPRVTLLLMFGVIVGESFLEIIPEAILGQFDLIANMTLVMIGFLLGGKLNRKTLGKRKKELLAISLGAALGTAVLVFTGLLLTGVPIEVALLIGCISTATAPAATVDVVDEANAKSPFAQLLLAIVAIDDAWGLVLFSLGFAVVLSISGAGGVLDPLLHAIHDIGGGILLGLVMGYPAAYLTGRIRSGRPILTEALGLVFLCGGIALWLDISFLIASMIMGMVVGNFARHHEVAFHEIENIEWPFLIIFFVLAGAQLEISSLKTIGIVGLVYVLCRFIGKFAGAWIGGTLGKTDTTTRRWIGPALLPQAGVALGMALVAANRFPEHEQMLLSVIISTTVIFELVGPVFTRLSLKKAGNIALK